MKGRKEFYERAKEKEIQRQYELENEEKLTGKDYFAMISSAFLVIFPVAVGLIIALGLLVLWIFGAI